MRALRPEILSWLGEGRPFALATVTRVAGSGPRGAGSCLIVSADGTRFFGSVSSGCLENEVIEAAVSALKDGSVRELRFGPEGAPPWSEGLGCGGYVSVRVEPWWSFAARAEVRAVGDKVAECLKAGSPLAVLSTEHHHLALSPDGTATGDGAAFSPDLWAGALDALAQGRTSQLLAGGRVFVRTLPVLRQLTVVGAVDVARHLARMAGGCGFRCTVVDPRRHYATTERFAGVIEREAMVCSWPAEGITPLRLGRRDAAVVLTHDPKIDDEALEQLLRTDVGYIGAMGSHASHQARLVRLRERGISEAVLARIEGPAGIRLDSREPAGIAVGILAGIVRWKAAQESA
jgi:xanthine dehydrogenase accessory factor